MDSDDGLVTLKELGEALIESILDGNHSLTSAILEKDPPLWYQNDAEGIAALHAAAYTENLELTRILLQKGAPWNSGRPNFTHCMHDIHQEYK